MALRQKIGKIWTTLGKEIWKFGDGKERYGQR